MKIILLFILSLFFVTTTISAQEKDTMYVPWSVKDLQQSIEYCASKTLATIENLASYKKSPRTILSGEKHWNAKSAGGWTSGFWAGILWYVYEGTGNEKIKLEAEKFTEEISPILEQPVKSHDIGFIFNCSFGNGYRLTRNERYKKILMSAADSLAHLFNDKVGTILSWPYQVKEKLYSPHNTIIDNMMNLELLFLASNNSSNATFQKMAISHANVTQKNHISSSATVYHVLVYDDITGECIRKFTHQGYNDSSLWARGQAWGIYGFTMCYRQTKDKKYLATAKALATAYLQRLPKDYVPFWDFDDSAIPNAPRDASAAAVVASALLELSELEKNIEEKRYYRKTAEKILRSLSSPAYLSGSENDAFLLHSTGNKPKNSEVDIPIIYADYYYIEALVRLKKIVQAENKIK